MESGNEIKNGKKKPKIIKNHHASLADKCKKTKKKKSLKNNDDDIKDPRLLKYVTGEHHQKFFEDNNLTLDRITNFMDGLKKLHDAEESNKLKLFSDKEDIFIQITCFKIPKTPTRNLRFMLPRTLVSKGDNILLFVKDIMKGRKNTEKSEEFHKELLQKNNIDIISEVMCLTRLKNEYNQYELKRKLLNSYETFLVDGRISGHLAHFLGKIFIKKRKLPTPIKMDAENLNEQIDKGLRKTFMTLHSTGDTYALRIGSTAMNNKHIAENFMAICTQLAKIFPGGWQNIRCIRIKTPLGMGLPIYISSKSKNSVKTPVVGSKRPKAYTDVKGELTTLTYDNNVTVSPEGMVQILKRRKLEQVEESNESENKDKDKITKKKKKTMKTRKIQEK